MLEHKEVWNGVDRLAAKHGLSASGLAKRAGLDPTTFNKSKRITNEGKPRWPSTESISKILTATNTTMADFVSLIYGDESGMPKPLQRVKCIRISDVEQENPFDASGFPGKGPWDEIDVPFIDDRHAYVIELDRDLAPPVYRTGDLLIVSPSSSIRRHDRVLARRRGGELEVGILTRRTAQRVLLDDLLGRGEERALSANELSWLARIVWVSQ
jgi:phage repressor protein C with HTH and peptisase S24 domain